MKFKLSAKTKINLKSVLPPFIYLLLTSLLIFLNYEPNTWFTGWDNLHPEFNPDINLKRALDTTWQEYQSLGLVGGMGHAADLLRQLFLIPFYSFLHPSLIRYLFAFITLTLGPIGTYFLTRHTLTNFPRFSINTKIIAAFFAGLFYLLNLGTLQTFYAPFETFIAFYASLPWLLLSVFVYLDSPTRRHLLFLILVNLLSTPSFYIQTLFLVYLLTLLPIIITHLLKKEALLQKISTLFFLSLITLITHAFWLFPVVHFTLNNASVTLTSAQNHLGTQDVALRNQEFGDLKNVTLLKGFWFDFVSLNPATDKFEIMMGPWTDHLNQPVVLIIGYSFFALVLIGLFYSLKKHLPHSAPLAFTLFLSLFFLINSNPPTGFLFDFLTDQIPLLGQSFRSVYTKWSTPAALSYSLFFSIGVIFLLDLFSFLHTHLTTFITSFTLILTLLIFSGPMFQGHLIYPAMKQSIPDAYFQLFDFFDHQDKNTRIANLPQHTLWGWQFYNWGYQGSGFLWYGIEQPILDRAFDTWSSASENYYHQISQAIYSQNLTQLENLIDQYQINWFVLDRSLIIPASTSQKALFIPQIEKLLNQSDKIDHISDFDFISVYQTNPSTQPQNFFSTKAFNPQPIIFTDPELDTTQFNLLETPSVNRSTTKNEATNCDPYNSTSYTKTIAPDKITYTSINANLCDHFTYPQLPHAYGYKITIDHQNISGQPLLVCLESYASGTCLIYQYLDTDSSHPFTTSTLIIPPMNPQDYGYTLHLYNYSIGRLKTENAWRQIEIQPLNPTTFDLTPNSSTHPYTQLNTTQKRAYSLYTASASSSQANSLLVLNQAYDEGWKAYQANFFSQKLPNWLLYLNSLLLVPIPEDQHIIANDWANGWLLPQDDSHLIIVYRPQLLQFFGFSLLLFLPLLTFLHPNKQD